MNRKHNKINDLLKKGDRNKILDENDADADADPDADSCNNGNSCYSYFKKFLALSYII